MKKIKQGLALSAMMYLILIGTPSTAHADNWSNDCCDSCHFESGINFDLGYRWDKIGNHAFVFGEEPGGRISTEEASNIQSVQVGLSGIWANCNNNFYLRGEGHYSKIFEGDYLETTFLGDICGHSWDVNVAIGYLIDMNCCWGIAPVIGWSYDKLDLEAKKVTYPIDVDDEFVPIVPIIVDVPNIQFENCFHGPFVGFDTLFCLNECTQVSFGYELHWAKWEGTRITNVELGQPFGTTTGFSNKRKHTDIWGNVFRIEGDYSLYNCWNLGLELKYQNYKSINTGKFRRTKTPLDPAFRLQLVDDVYWQSFSALLKVGYDF